MTDSKSTAKPGNDKPARTREEAAARPGGVAGQCHPSQLQPITAWRPLRAFACQSRRTRAVTQLHRKSSIRALIDL